MIKIFAASALSTGLLVAQAPLDWGALLEQLPSNESPADVADVIASARPWAEAVTEHLSDDDRAALLGDGPSVHPVARAVAISSLLASAGRELAELGPRDLYEQAVACGVLTLAAGEAEVVGAVAASRTPEWAKRVRAPAIARGRAALSRLLRQHPAARDAAQALVQCWDLLLPDEVSRDRSLVGLRRRALEQLGDAADVGAWLGLTGMILGGRDLAAAGAALERAREARAPVLLGERERRIDGLEGAAEWLAAAASSRRAGEAADDSPLAGLQQAVLYREDDTEARARALLASGVEHALPEVVLAWGAFMAGRRGEAGERVARAAALPGADLRVAVLRLLVALPELQRRSAKSPDDVETRLAAVQLLSDFNALVEDVDGPVATGARVMLDAVDAQFFADEDPLPRFASLLAEAHRAPSTKQEYLVGLIGAASALMAGRDDDYDLALSFLDLPIAAALARRPLLMRQRASVATIVAAQTMIGGASSDVQGHARALAAQAREDSRALGDRDWAAYLGLVERWVAARDDEEEGQVLKDLGGLDVMPVQDGAWQPGSTALVMASPAGAAFDRTRFLSLRAATGADSPSALVPLAVTMMVQEPASAKSMFAYLRGALPPGSERNILSVAEIAGGAPPAVAAARARAVLASEDWSEFRARRLAHGLHVTGSMHFGFAMQNLRPSLDCRFECTPVMLPKLKVATRLQPLARRR